MKKEVNLAVDSSSSEDFRTNKSVSDTSLSYSEKTFPTEKQDRSTYVKGSGFGSGRLRVPNHHSSGSLNHLKIINKEDDPHLQVENKKNQVKRATTKNFKDS